jgi:hypothetical protein
MNERTAKENLKIAYEILILIYQIARCVLAVSFIGTADREKLTIITT